MSVITIGVAFITSATALYLLSKRHRRVSLSKFDKIVGVSVIIEVIIVILSFNPSQSPIFLAIQGWVSPELWGSILGFVFAYAILGIIFLVRKYIITHKSPSGIHDERPSDNLPFYRSVNEAQDILKISKKDFWVIGTTSAYWSEVKRTNVIDAVKDRRLSCRFLLSNPNSDFIEVSKQCGIIGEKTNKEEIQQSADYFLQLKNSPELTGKNLQDKVEIRTFDLPFLYSMTLSDPYDDNGIIYVEPYSYITPKGDRFILVIKKSDQPKLFERYQKSYEYVWSKATSIK